MLPAQDAHGAKPHWLGRASPAVQKLVTGSAALPRTFARLVTLERTLLCLVAGGLAALIWFSLRLAAMRMFQVDECNNIFVARMIATGRLSR